MDAYSNLIESLIKREIAILGRERIERILQELNIHFDFEKGKLINYLGNGFDELERLGNEIYRIGGEIVLIGARVNIILNASRERLELPAIFS